MTKIGTVVMDKTGTLTKGVFKVWDVVAEGIEKEVLIRLAAGIEKNSTHPVAKAVVAYAGDKSAEVKGEKVEEVSGHGMKGMIEGSNCGRGGCFAGDFGCGENPKDEIVTCTAIAA